MSYNSLFSIAKEKDHLLFDFTHNQEQKQALHRYEGRLCDVIESIQEQFQLIWEYGLELVPPELILKLLLMNGRLLRSILDSKDTEMSSHLNYPSLIEWFLDFSFCLYNLHSDTLEVLSSLVEQIDDILLYQDVFQQDDSESWVSMDPYFSQKTAYKLKEELWSGEYTFIALWHGGIIPGIDVFLRLQEQMEESGQIYPIRFSRIKHKDKKPKLWNDYESKYLSESIRWKPLIIFDEDSSSGNTLKQAREFFEWEFSGFDRILQVSNLWKWDYQTTTFIV